MGRWAGSVICITGGGRGLGKHMALRFAREGASVAVSGRREGRLHQVVSEIEGEGADVVVIAYGITARVARMGIDLAREQGAKVGFLRLVTVWPFPEQRIRELADEVKAFVVPEINYGQMVLEVERAAAGKTRTVSVPHGGGSAHDPQVIADAIVGAVK